MGKVASKAVRPVKNFNIENRAQKVLGSEKPRPAPRHPSTAAVFENIAQEHPEYLEEQQKKHAKLDEFLKKVRVDSVGDNPEIKAKSVRSLPEDRRKVIPAEYGMPDPDNIREGRASLRQALEFISQHHLDPKQNSALKIATDYKLDATKVQHVLKYFQMLRLHVPKEMLDKNPGLLSSLDSSSVKRQSISGMEDVMKLGQGVETVGNKASDPQPKN